MKCKKQKLIERAKKVYVKSLKSQLIHRQKLIKDFMEKNLKYEQDKLNLMESLSEEDFKKLYKIKGEL